MEAAQIPIRGHDPIRVTVSIGVCAQRETADRPESLQGDADKALYTAKQQGGNRVVVWSGAPAPPLRAIRSPVPFTGNLLTQRYPE